MDSRKEHELESTLTAWCARPVKVTQRMNSQVCVVFEPSGDRGRLELIVAGAGTEWIVSDRGAVGALYGLDLDVVIEKLAAFDAGLVRRDDEIIMHSGGRSLAEAVAEFVESIEFVPVLDGLFANQVVVWPDSASMSTCVAWDRWNQTWNAPAM